jgi:biotin carboxyl carrier protein
MIVHVEQGDKVAKGERLFVMEAMKMQTAVYAPIAGTVKRLAVSQRHNVEARDLLLTIE